MFPFPQEHLLVDPEPEFPRNKMPVLQLDLIFAWRKLMRFKMYDGLGCGDGDRFMTMFRCEERN